MSFLLTAGGSEFQCTKIDYFPEEEYNPDANDSTNAIPCKVHYFYLREYIDLRF